jgi:hypothetical protein
MNNFLIIIFLIILSVTQSSCTKQSAPEVLSDRPRSVEELNRSKACEKVNFIKNIVLRDNLISLFDCTGWSKKFPAMYASLEKISRSDWNHLFAPISEQFFDDKKRQDRVFKKIKNLDSKHGLDDLAKVINTLSDTNFYDAVNDYYTCAEDPKKKTCKKRRGRIVSKKEIMDLLSLITIDSNLYGYMARTIKHVVAAIQGDAEDFRSEIGKYYNHTSFFKLRLRIADYVAARVIDGITEQDRSFVAKLLFTKIKNENKYVLEKWLNSDSMNAEKFHNLISYSSIQKTNFIKDIMVIKNGFDEGLSCEYQDGEGQIVMDERKHVGLFLHNLLNLNYLEFNKKILRHSALIVTAEPYCKKLQDYSSMITFIDGEEIKTEKHNLSFREVMSKFSELMSAKENFQIAKILANSSVKNKDEQPFYLMELMSGVIYQSINELNKVILTHSNDYYKILYKILRRVDPELFPAAGAISMITMGEKHKKSFQGVAKFWKFLNDTEKNFLFKFIDKHLQKDTNYVLLFDFYSQMLEEMPDVVSLISKRYIGNRETNEKTYSAIRNIVKHLSGKNTLEDFKNFFSRDYIIKAMKIISRGVSLGYTPLGSFEDTYIDNYVLRSRQNPFMFIFSNGDFDADHIINCAKEITDSENDFYALIRNLPESCKSSDKAVIAVRIFSWIDYIASGFDALSERQGIINKGSLADEKGLFGAASLRSSIVLLTRIDQSFSPENNNSGGIKYLLDSLFETFYQKKNPAGELNGYYYELESALKMVNEFHRIGGQSKYYRQSLVKKITKQENFKTAGELIGYTGKIFSDYGHWYNKTGASNNVYDRHELQPEKYKCKNFHNLSVGGDPCPEPLKIKKNISTVIDYLRIKNDKDRPTAIELLLKSAIADQGLYIPYQAQNQRVKRLSLLESFKMMYQLTNREDKTNQMMIQYLPVGVRPKQAKQDEYLQPMTTLERIEVTIREINFDGSYLAAIYHNAVSRSENYNESVGETVKLFKTCHKLHFCGKTFKKDEYRRAHNGIKSYFGLLDANTIYGYGDYMQSLLQILVGSSSKKSSKQYMLSKIPKVPTKKQMKKHNGKIVFKISQLSAFSNLGRVIQDRVGRTEKEFRDFVDSKEFKLFSAELLRGFDNSQMAAIGADLMNNLLEVKNEKGERIHEKVVDYLAGLSYADLKFVERTISKLIVVVSYLGSSEEYFLKNNLTKEELYLKRRYAKNNFYNFFKAISSIVKIWPVMAKALPVGLNGEEFKLIEFLKPVNNILSFLQIELAAKKSPAENIYYKFLNESFLALNEGLFFETENHKSGISYSLAMLQRLDLNQEVQITVRSLYSYFDQLHKNRSGNAFIEFGEKIKSLSNDQLLNMKALRDYLHHTTREDNCLANEKKCLANIHFDEPAKLLGFALETDGKSSDTNLSLGFKNLLVNDRDSLIELINDVMPYVNVVPVTENILPFKPE